jgi:hypothetical protein
MTETNAYVLGVDPGTTTGLHVVTFIGEEGTPRSVWQGQFGWHDACAEIDLRLRDMRHWSTRGGRAAVAPEQFTLNSQSAQRGQQGADDALGMLGVVQHYAAMHDVSIGPRETASAAKNLISDNVLRHYDIYHKGQPHSNDAARHALLLATKRGWMSGKTLAAGALS